MRVGRERWWLRVLATTALAAVTGSAASARAADGPTQAADEPAGKPWLPLIEDGASPDDVYEKHALSVVHVGEAGWRVNRGKYREGVAREDFYVTIGRADLASRERSGEGLRSGLIWGGAAVTLVGGGLMFAGISHGGFDPPPMVGFAVMGAGIATLLIGSMVHGPDVPVGEVDAMVARYNARLRAHIEEGGSRPCLIQARFQVVTPFVDGRSGGGLAAIARF